ncbi:MAG TPA: hypothetical protein VNK52_13365 [Hyphomicrobiaceae bacterium]|nr:hypothetical protein [Hyphomicrobiaceae bacterium]
MSLEEMMQHAQESMNVLLIAPRLRDPHVIDDHVADLFAAMLLPEQILGQCTGSDPGQMLVLGDGKPLLLGQATESDAAWSVIMGLGA